MDQLASVLLAFPPEDAAQLADNEQYHKAAQIHVARLYKLLKERTRDLVTHASDLFNVVNPAVNSLSFLTLLHALSFPSPAANVSRDVIAEKFAIFAMTFDGRQCRYAAGLWGDFIQAISSGQLIGPAVAIECLVSAILRLDPSGSILTSTHLTLVSLAYRTNNIYRALPVIDKNIVFYPDMSKNEDSHYLCDLTLPPPAYISRLTGLTQSLKSTNVLDYGLVCGLMYISVRDWEKAGAALEKVVTHPTKEGGVSTYMVDAYKKWILVHLLCTGSFRETPPLVSAATNKSYSTLAKPYTQLARAFASDEAAELKSIAEQNTSIWVEDANVGLVKEVLNMYQKWRVLLLKDVYDKISISEIRQQTKSAETGQKLASDDEVEFLIHEMITQGLLKGTMGTSDDGTKFLAFFSNTAQALSETQFAVTIQETASRLAALRSAFLATNQRLSTNKDYIRYAIRDAKRDKLGESLDPTLGFEASVDDEDLMGGLATVV